MKILIADDNDIQVCVHDNGSGIMLSQREEVLKPFVRGKHKNNAVNGHGIGLALVKRIVDWHHGVLSITDSLLLGGACFTIKLPKK